MFLKSLDIFGFKSFADKTHIEFSEGITALLGPNGCGKSNVVDAIKWVLAENRAKNLRAETMESVIFNGCETRPPLNIAEVTLTISNEAGLLPLDHSEISIKRRLYRSGENEYFLNNKQVGPTEIRRLFMDTGVGKAAYSVMEQGKIDQILSSKPEDRRYLFEEAAGISRSKAEYAEAERELERTKQNLSQIEVALTENKRSYENLKIQSEKTIKYRAIKDEIFNYELDIQLLKLKDFIQNKLLYENKKNELEEKRASVQNEISLISETLSESNEKIKSSQKKMNDLQMELVKIQTEKTNKLELAKQYNSQSNQAKEKIATLEIKKSSVQERIDTLNEELDEQDADIREKTKRIENIKKNIVSVRENIDSTLLQIKENDKLSATKSAEIEKINKERADFQKDLKAITEDIVTKLDAKLKDSDFSSSASKQAKEELDTAISHLKIYSEGRKNIFLDFKTITGHSESESEKIVNDAINAFDEISNLISEIEKSVKKYSASMPDFIDEFLAPEGIITKKRAIDFEITNCQTKTDSLQKQIADLREKNYALSKKTTEYRETLGKFKTNEAAMEAQIKSSKKSSELLKRTIANEKNNLRQYEDEFFAEKKRFDSLQNKTDEIQQTLSSIEVRGTKCAEELSNLHEQITEYNSSVSETQNKLKKKQEEFSLYQEKYEQLALKIATNNNDIKNIKQNFAETHTKDLSEFEERMDKITTSPAILKEQLAKSKESLKTLGAVNLMADIEFREQKERYEKLKSSFDDTNKSLENLTRVSEEIKSKATEMFLDTYNKIKRNFHNMFRRLFSGGKAELRLLTPQNVLTSGVDIFAQPPGKKLENIALLSGGEKTMTAVALLFATYQVRPSPFCLLDEIDAALDDKNVTSFIQTLRSFSKLSQYIVITHNRKTVTGAKTLLGITMEESGISKIITIRLDKDIKTGEDIPDTQDFEEEDVAPEENVYIPQRPPKRTLDSDKTADLKIDREIVLPQNVISESASDTETPVGTELNAIKTEA